MTNLCANCLMHEATLLTSITPLSNISTLDASVDIAGFTPCLIDVLNENHDFSSQHILAQYCFAVLSHLILY